MEFGKRVGTTPVIGQEPGQKILRIFGSIRRWSHKYILVSMLSQLKEDRPYHKRKQFMLY